MIESFFRAPDPFHVDAHRNVGPTDGPEKRIVTAPSLEPLRQPADATRIIGEYEARLPLDPATRRARAQRMAADPLVLFRSAPALFHADMAGPYAADLELFQGRPAPRILVQGDAHLGNFGTFRGPRGEAVYGLNDFDQAGTGSPALDLARLATSAVLAARRTGLAPGAEDELARAAADAYFETIRAIASGRDRGGPWLREGETHGPVRAIVADAEHDGADRAAWIARRTAVGPDGRLDFRHDDEVRPLEPAKAALVREALEPAEVLATAAKLGSGGSSFGLERYYALVAPASGSGTPVIVEVKELPPPALACAPGPVDGQRVLGTLVNPLTRLVQFGRRELLARELEPEKGDIDLAEISSLGDLRAITEDSARALARAHGHVPRAAAAIAAWEGDDPSEGARRLSALARTYARQVEVDRAALASPGRSGASGARVSLR